MLFSSAHTKKFQTERFYDVCSIDSSKTESGPNGYLTCTENAACFSSPVTLDHNAFTDSSLKWRFECFLGHIDLYIVMNVR